METSLPQRALADASHAFVSLAECLQALAKREGMSVRPYDGPAPRSFLNLDLTSQQQVLGRLALYVEICEAVTNGGYSLHDDRQMLWAAIKRLKLRPSAELFGTFDDDDVIEVYLVPQMVQIFRSFRFFSLCSYSLDDLLCRPWWDLYERSDAVTERLMATAETGIARGEGITHYDVGPHIMRERDSPGRFSSLQELRFMAPLLTPAGKVGGVVNVVRPHYVTVGRGANAGADLIRDFQRT